MRLALLLLVVSELSPVFAFQSADRQPYVHSLGVARQNYWSLFRSQETAWLSIGLCRRAVIKAETAPAQRHSHDNDMRLSFQDRCGKCSRRIERVVSASVLQGAFS